MSLVLRKLVFRTRSDTNRAVQQQKMARGLKFRIYEVEGLYYPCSENKGADQLRGHREADLRLCFHICTKPVFLQWGSYLIKINSLFFLENCSSKSAVSILIRYQFKCASLLFLHRSMVCTF